MSLLDTLNNIIYWDEVNWQWLPYVSTKVNRGKLVSRLKRNGSYTSKISREIVIQFLIDKGYSFRSLESIGVVEVSLGCYLYKGKVYQRDSGHPLKNFSTFLSMVSGKSQTYIFNYLKGRGVLSNLQLEGLFSTQKVLEYKGKIYKSQLEFIKEYGFSRTYFAKCQDKGMSLDEIVSNYKNFKDGRVDHLGKEFKTEKEMAKHWGISLEVYKGRRRSGWSLEKSLTTPTRLVREPVEYRDFKGRVFSSAKSMAKEYKVSSTTLLRMLDDGKSTEEVTHFLSQRDVHRRRGVTCSDHLGNTFPTKSEMFKYWGITKSTFENRIRRSWSLEEALTGKRKKKNKSSK